MTPTRRFALACAAAAAAWTWAAPVAHAQAFPAKPIKLIVNFPPGGAADVIGRSVAQALTEQLKQQVVVENRPGANGAIGVMTLKNAPADGYTLLMASNSPMIVTSPPVSGAGVVGSTDGSVGALGLLVGLVRYLDEETPLQTADWRPRAALLSRGLTCDSQCPTLPFCLPLDPQ